MGFVLPLALAAGSAAGTAGLSAGALSLAGFGGIGWGTALSLAGTAVSTIGSLSKANSEKNAAQYNAGIDANNKQIADQNAQLAEQQGNIATEQAQMKTRADAAGLMVQQAASGVDVNSGSSLDVRSSAAQLGQLNAINIRSDATRKAYGYKTDAAGYGAQEDLDNAKAKSAGTAGLIDASTSLLGGLGNADSSYNNYLSKGGL